MNVDVLQQKKEEVASVYLKDLKEELGFLKGSIVGLFGTTLKDMMTSDESVGESLDTSKLNFREKMLVNISPITAEKVFTFVKEKQETIQTAKTDAELESLKAGIVIQSTTNTPPTTTTSTTTPETNPTVPTTTPTEETTEETTEEDKTTEEKLTEEETKEQETKEEDEEKNEEEKKDKAQDKEDNIKTSVAIGGGLGLGVIATDKIYKLQEAKKITNNIDLKTPEQFAVKMKSQFDDLSKQLMKEAKNNNKLTQFQAKALSKSAKEFEKIAKNMDEGTIDAVGMLGKLDRKLPASILKSISPKQTKMLMKLTESDFSLIKAGKEVDAIKGLNKEVVNVLKSADSVDEMMSMAKVLTKSKGVNGFLKGIKGVAFLDLISTGFDVRVLCEGLDEADAYAKLNIVRSNTKREHQWVQFGASVAITALGIIGTCAAAGSVVPGLGTAVGVAVGALGYAASVAVDIYYDKVEFYLQNEADFKKQYRTEIKQAIIQSAASEEWNLDLQAKAHAEYEKGQKITTTEEARKALIRQEEYTKPEYIMIQQWTDTDKSETEFLATLTDDKKAEYKKQKKALDVVIDKRLEYVELFMYKNKTKTEYKSLVSAMKSGMGIKQIEKILADSKTYYDMNQEGDDQYVTGSKTIEEYKTTYQEKLKTEDATKFATFETMREKDPYTFLEIYAGVENFETIFDNQKKESEDPTTEQTEEIDEEDKTTEEIDETTPIDENVGILDVATIEAIQGNIDFIKKFYEYKTMGLPIEEQKKLEISIRMIDNKNIEKMLTTGNFDIANVYKEENVKRYFTNHGILDRMETKVEVSDSVGQNIIYRIATEIHGYTGSNNMKDLIAFFSMGKENATGLYYDDKWIVNNDWAIDKGIAIDQFESMTTEEILKERTRSNNRNRILEFAVPNPLGPIGAITGGTGVMSVYGFTDTASMIDTPTEDMDDQLNQEYRKRLGAIVAEEKGYNETENKKIIEEAIVTYITENAKEEGYIELPYYLIIAAKKAKIGDLQKYLFANKAGKITACTTKLYLDDKLDFSQTATDIQKEYIGGVTEGLSENAQEYIDYVDAAKKSFEDLITNDVDELDIPKEYLEVYQGKITEWDTIKQSLDMLDPATAKSQLQAKYQEYHDYFENTYIAMLEVISKFGKNIFSSNDLDSATYHQQIEYIAVKFGGISISKEGMITIPKDQMTEVQKGLYAKMLVSQKIDGKSIKELAKSKKEADQTKAIRGVKQIIKSILEAEMLDFNEEGEITNIRYGEQQNKIMESAAGGLTQRLKVHMTDTEYFDPSKHEITEEEIDESKIVIKSLTEEEEKTTETTNEVEKIIKETEPDLVYPGRGLVTFDPETSVLTSRGKEITIDAKKMTIEGLSISFTNLTELIMMANIMNRFTYKYPGQKDFYFGSGTIVGGYYGIYKPVDRGSDDRILTLDTIKEKFPSILDEDNNVKEEIMKYINSIT